MKAMVDGLQEKQTTSTPKPFSPLNPAQTYAESRSKQPGVKVAVWSIDLSSTTESAQVPDTAEFSFRSAGGDTIERQVNLTDGRARVVRNDYAVGGRYRGRPLLKISS